MTNKTTLDESTVQNLQDAGCGKDFIESFACIGKEEPKKRLSLLSKHRAVLLKNLHKYQKKIDCLDYLIYRIGKEQE